MQQVIFNGIQDNIDKNDNNSIIGKILVDLIRLNWVNVIFLL